jgi:hypothetical protein
MTAATHHDPAEAWPQGLPLGSFGIINALMTVAGKVADGGKERRERAVRGRADPAGLSRFIPSGR